MKLSTKSRYAARLMVRLAKLEDKGPIQLNDISRMEEISEKYLSQIVIPLRNARLIKSVRGARGGYMLAQRSESITVYDVVNVMEGGIEMVECQKDGSDCNRATHCVTTRVWTELRIAMEETLRRHTLKGLVESMKEEQDPMYYI